MTTTNKLQENKRKVLQDKATEAPGSGALLHNKAEGTYECAQCSTELFDSTTKFDSSSGWPSFYDAKTGSVLFVPDNSLGIERIEAVCKSCGGHLGHVFEDAANQPTGQRYCINSAALNFKSSDGEMVEG